MQIFTLVLLYYDWYKQKDIVNCVFTLHSVHAGTLYVITMISSNKLNKLPGLKTNKWECTIQRLWSEGRPHRQKLSEAIHSEVRINKSISINRHRWKLDTTKRGHAINYESNNYGQSHGSKAQTGPGLQTNFLQARPKFCMVIGQFSPGFELNVLVINIWPVKYIWKWDQVSTHSWFILRIKRQRMSGRWTVTKLSKKKINSKAKKMKIRQLAHMESSIHVYTCQAHKFTTQGYRQVNYVYQNHPWLGHCYNCIGLQCVTLLKTDSLWPQKDLSYLSKFGCI
jgi:hypothetical protein